MIKLIKDAKVLNANMEFSQKSILIKDTKIQDIFSPEDDVPNVDVTVNAKKLYFFPGLINSHDHLYETGSYHKFDKHFNNWYEWLAELKKTENYASVQKLSLTDLYLLGMYKNAISGVTTIVDHFPPEASKAFFDHPLVSLLKNFFLIHSVSERSLLWGRNLQEEFNRSRALLPFITHIGEGKGSEISEEVEILNRRGALKSNTVLINGTYLSSNEIDIIASRKSSLVWLPNSSQNIFGKQPDISKILKTKIPLTIGTDSSFSGSTSLLNEMKFALDFSRKNLNGDISAKDIVKMVTADAAKIFKIDSIVGKIAQGVQANLIAIEVADSSDPFEALINSSCGDLAIIMHNGELICGDLSFRKLSSGMFDLYAEVLIDNKPKILYGNPLRLLERVLYKTGTTIPLPFFPVSDIMN